MPVAHALKIMSLGFALGILTGRAIASRVLIHVTSLNVVLGSSVAMAVTTLAILLTGANEPATAAAVFCAGLAMAAAYPTTLGLVGDAFPRATGSAMGIVITSGWVGLAVISRLIGAFAGVDESNLPQALLLFPLFSVLLIGVSVAIRRQLSKHS